MTLFRFTHRDLPLLAFGEVLTAYSRKNPNGKGRFIHLKENGLDDHLMLFTDAVATQIFRSVLCDRNVKFTEVEEKDLSLQRQEFLASARRAGAFE